MQSVTISVIIPIYNVAPYLEECVDSVLRQTYTDFECILVDDGSTDECPAICDRYALLDPRVVVVHKKNGGLSDARNAGLEIARGKYIEFLDGDDWVDDTLLEVQLRAMEEYGAQIASTTFAETELEPSHIVHCGDGETMMMDYLREIKYGMKGLTGWSACCKLFDRSLLEGFRFEKGRKYEDLFGIPYVVFRCPRMVVMDDLMYHYRIREHSIMADTRVQTHPDLVDADEKLVAYCREKNIMPDAVIFFAVNHLYENFCREKRNGADGSAPFIVALRGFIRKHFVQIMKHPEVESIKKIRFGELALFGSIRLPMREL